jgi:phosphoglycolate phosphatase
MRFDLMVFDWDGTLIDSAAAITRAVQAACQELGLQVPPEVRARHVIGLGFKEALLVLAPELSEARYPDFVACYRRHFLGSQSKIALFAGALELVKALNDEGRLLAIATGKSRQGLDRDLDYMAFRGYFHATRCADECFSKPHPAMLLELMDELGVSPKRTLMVGDTSHDLEMAGNASLGGALAVAYGAHSRASLLALNPLGCADTVDDLARWLKENG